MTASNSIELSRQERETIALSLDFTLKELALAYAASCDAGKNADTESGARAVDMARAALTLAEPSST